jgi:hypothetical protein
MEPIVKFIFIVDFILFLVMIVILGYNYIHWGISPFEMFRIQYNKHKKKAED